MPYYILAYMSNAEAQSDTSSSADSTRIQDPDDPNVWADRVRASLTQDVAAVAQLPSRPSTPGQESGIDLPPDWVTEDEIANMVEVKTEDRGSSDEEIARKILIAGAPFVARGVLQIAIHSNSEATKLRAQTYVLDRVLGRPGEDLRDRGSDPLREFLEDLTNSVNAKEGK